MAILDPIEIPESALLPKPLFSTRPGAEIVREIKAFIAETGKPHLWRGHTHTRPEAGAPVFYVGEFDLPPKCRYQHHWAPCPCCSPFHPKYREGGKIAWFPEEQVIRLIGPDCFKALNAEGHAEALAALRKEQQREKDMLYLLDNLPRVPALLAATREAMPLATAVDDFRSDLILRLERTLEIDLWREIRHGKLRVRTQRREAFRRTDGSEGFRNVDDFRDYASIDGHDLLNPKTKRFTPRLQTVESHLEALLSYESPEGHDEPSDRSRRDAAKRFGNCSSGLRKLFGELEDIRRFGSVTTAATLRNWGAREDSPFRFYAERADGSFYIGRRREEKIRVPLSSAFDLPLPRVSFLSETKL